MEFRGIPWNDRTRAYGERMLIDLIDMQSLSTRELDRKLAEFKRDLVGMRAAAADALARADWTDPRVLTYHKQLRDILDTEEMIENLQRTGERSPYRFILTVKDHFTRYCWLRAIKCKRSSDVGGTYSPCVHTLTAHMCLRVCLPA